MYLDVRIVLLLVQFCSVSALFFFLPAVGYALLPAVGYALQPAVGCALSVLFIILEIVRILLALLVPLLLSLSTSYRWLCESGSICVLTTGSLAVVQCICAHFAFHFVVVYKSVGRVGVRVHKCHCVIDGSR